jgi:hypothetical protein
MENEKQQAAAQELAMVRGYQERTLRAARVPWWSYPVMFVSSVAVAAANDFVDVNGSKMLPIGVLVVLVVVAVTTFFGRSALLSRIRGVQPQQSFNPRAFFVVATVGSFGGWLIFRYGTRVTGDVAGAIGLSHYPNTVTGLLYGGAFTLLFALGQLLVSRSQRRVSR